MMRRCRIFTLLAFIILIKIVIIAPVENNDNKSIRVLKYDQGSEGGNFHYKFFLSDRHTEYKVGTLKEINGVPVVVVEGQYGYIGPDHYYNKVTYVADENGFVVKKLTRHLVASRQGQIDPRAVASLLGG